MINEKIRELKTFLQTITKTKSIKIYKNGSIDFVFRFKPKQLPVESDSLDSFEEDLLKKLKAITNFKWKVIRVQKQPSFCYNSYVRLLSISSSASKDKVKRFLSYFEKTNAGTFVRTSYCEIHFKVQPSTTIEFENFLLVKEF